MNIQEIADLIIEVNDVFAEINDAKRNINYLLDLIRKKPQYAVTIENFQYDSIEITYLKAILEELQNQLDLIKKELEELNGQIDSDDFK